ncbi:hypothetical protein ACI3KW_15890 [Devosia sp. ZW T5_3]|jgi:hypothetical protein|uniref:hypothetical protein n=1 Tax=Devosia sp. ZW T5_3 TaxID=3378085 RepID=UPI003851FAE6
MKTSSKKSMFLGLGLALLAGGAIAHADETASGKSYVLKDGTVHDTPGEMFQHLRTRDNGLAAGNPKDIVNAYPDEFENVGDLIQQKREAE